MYVYAAFLAAVFIFLVAQMYKRPKGQFDTVDAARVHCPTDTVVWLNTETGVFHYPGERWFGSTRSGAFMCLGEAATGGSRATMNGQ